MVVSISGNIGLTESPRQSGTATFEMVRERARSLAEKEFQPPAAKLPDFLNRLTYAEYQQIHYRLNKALWHAESSRVQVQFFHPGYLFREPVKVNIVEGGDIREFPFSPDQFDYGNLKLSEPVPPDLFFTGVCMLYPLNHPGREDEAAVFLGSSFFRLLGARQAFGASARGLAIDTGEPGGEEFPRFTDFWIEKPGVAANSLRLCALLESRRVCGAYEFVITPGEETVAEVRATLFFREPVTKVGLAALTSMFLYGENRTAYFPDFRGEVHDSDGLLLRAADQRWLWRPLVNPPKVHRLSDFPLASGFGLMQRDRDFDHYQDLGAKFETRPSLWVTPREGWPAGKVQLVEIPSPEEKNDNMVVYWVPDQKMAKGQELSFQYTLRACSSQLPGEPETLWRVKQTFVEPREKGRVRYLVDFTDGPRAKPGEPALTPQVELTPGKAENVVLMPNEPAGGWRAFFDWAPDGKEPGEARLWLRDGNRVASEVWVYRPPKPN
ncbi:MAG TPA: glucan biosynthesis protein [Verrucomicrobiae bacterium]|nr:glucan biosynthesis protein [Verrucomicrobiae bacterium]